jgi:hypothetical protein
MRMNCRLTRGWGRQTLSVLLLVLPGCLWAQRGGADNGARAACERARAGLSPRADVAEVRRSVVDIQGCPDTAAIALGEAWNSPPTDSVALRLLGEVSGRISDRRLLSAVTRVAKDSGRPLEERLAAFRALAAYVVPGATLLYQNLGKPDLPGVGYVMMGAVSHPVVLPGREALTPSDQSAAVETLENLGATDTNPQIRAIASYIAGRLTKLREERNSPK